MAFLVTVEFCTATVNLRGLPEREKFPDHVKTGAARKRAERRRRVGESHAPSIRRHHTPRGPRERAWSARRDHASVSDVSWPDVRGWHLLAEPLARPSHRCAAIASACRLCGPAAPRATEACAAKDESTLVIIHRALRRALAASSCQPRADRWLLLHRTQHLWASLLTWHESMRMHS